MAKAKILYECQNCGYKSPKWMGQCASCKAWESMVETVDAGKRSKAAPPMPKIASYGGIRPEAQARFSSGIGELDRVLGGGFVPGSILLVGGDPGIGKSTLLLQVAANLQNQGKSVMYLSGEESLFQIKMRGERLRLEAEDLSLLAETSFEVLEAFFHESFFDVIVIDSIQTMYTRELPSAPGSVSQVREVTARIQQLCKPKNITVILVGHITKEGAIAGPKTLEHMVDGVFYFEGDKYNNLRLLRAQKNRFGPANELGIFQMEVEGLREVSNPSQVLLEQRPESCAGSVVAPCIEGTRPLAVEVQVLVSGSTYASPRRLCMGVDSNRVALILAVLEKKAGLQLQGLDVFVNIVGGISIQEPALDLALALAVYSAFRNVVLNPRIAVFGEVGLAGEIRSVSQTGVRLKECANLGFSTVICPKGGADQKIKGMKIHGVSNLVEALEKAL